MKTFMKGWIPLWVFLTLTLSCSEEQTSTEQEAKTAVTFTFDLGDNPGSLFRADVSPYGSCATAEDLNKLCDSGNLKAILTIKKETDTEAKVERLALKPYGTQFQVEPILLNPGKYEVLQVSIVDDTNPETDNLLFSGVATEGLYHEYVKETLPKKFKIGTSTETDETDYQLIPLYQKGTLDLYLLCVQSETATEFGYVRWNLHTSKLYQIPFMVYACSENELDVMGTGSIEIQNGSYTESIFTEATGDIIAISSNFGQNETNTTGLGTMTFVDNYDIDNAQEWYRMIITLTKPVAATYTGYATVETLIKYKENNPSWNENYHFLNLSFCGERNCWFFR